MKSEEQQCVEDRFKAKRRRERIEKAGYFVTSFGILFLVWELTRAVGLIDPKLFPSIQAVLKACVVGFKDGSLQMHIYASFMRVLTSFTIGILLAVVFGFLVGWFRVVRLFLDPVINFFRALPPIALIPLMIIFFGIGETSKLVVLSYAAFSLPWLSSTRRWVGLDPIYIRAAKTLGAGNMEIFRKIILPQLVPHIITACRVSLGVCWATLVAAELIAAQKGIGAMMVDAQTSSRWRPWSSAYS